MKINKKKLRKLRKRRNTSVIKGTNLRPRIVFCESNRYIRVQAIDDDNNNTISFLSTEKINLEKKTYSKKNKEYAKKIGELFSEELKKKNFNNIVFDRNSRLYCGKIKIFCDIMRKKGINF